jgi:putative ABC transport system substrate-binding protein
MRRTLFLGSAWLLLLAGLTASCGRPARKLYTLGLFQITDAPTLNEVRRGFVQALADSGLRDGVEVRLIARNAMGDTGEARRIAQGFVDSRADLIVALSTQCLQAALLASPQAPILFTSVANPQLLGVGKSPESRSGRITGVASTAPIKQALAFIREVLPGAGRIGTLWTPSELNSEYYLKVLREEAAELGFEVIAAPVANINAVLLAVQLLLNKKVDLIFPVSDNTINAAFGSLGRVAADNGIPLFGGSPLFTRLGACAAMGWDFYEMGYRTGEIAVRIKKGEDPSRIPIQSMNRIRLRLNLAAAQAQGVVFPPQIMARADEITGQDGRPQLGEHGSE